VTETQQNWLKQKYEELAKSLYLFGNEYVQQWDLWRFIRIIENQAREIRRLKTEVLKK
jgi:hypothetical protein